jgi:hypothetical protein
VGFSSSSISESKGSSFGFSGSGDSVLESTTASFFVFVDLVLAFVFSLAAFLGFLELGFAPFSSVSSDFLDSVSAFSDFVSSSPEVSSKTSSDASASAFFTAASPCCSSPSGVSACFDVSDSDSATVSLESSKDSLDVELSVSSFFSSSSFFLSFDSSSNTELGILSIPLFYSFEILYQCE